MFEELNWDDERLNHIAEHGVTIGEVLEVLVRRLLVAEVER